MHIYKNSYLTKFLWRYTRRPYAEAYAEGLTRRSYAEVLREPVFQWGMLATAWSYTEALRGGLTRSPWDFF